MKLAALAKESAPAEIKPSASYTELKDFVMASAKEVCDVIDALSDEELKGEITMPWGAVYPVVEAILLPSSHMSYHDGQMNYIQLLLGDTMMHWHEE
jgi:uncharacterized damage-inducible protein DinB